MPSSSKPSIAFSLGSPSSRRCIPSFTGASGARLSVVSRTPSTTDGRAPRFVCSRVCTKAATRGWPGPVRSAHSVIARTKPRVRRSGLDAEHRPWNELLKSHQETTIETYDAVAAEYLERTRNFPRGREWVRRFANVVPPGSLVADVGSGAGRDTALLRSHGLNAFCLDLSLGQLLVGRLEFPANRVQANFVSLPLRSACLEGAWANASLLHLSTAEFRAAAREIRRVLRPGGHLHLSVKLGDGTEWESSQYSRPRWFRYWSGGELDRELMEAALSVVDSSEEESKSARWLVRLCRAV